MKYLAFVLYSLQLYLTFRGTEHFGKYGNPAVLFIVSMAIPAIYLYQLVRGTNNEQRKTTQKWMVALSLLITVVCSVIICIESKERFAFFNHPENISDVIPQLEALWDRYARGEQPYYPLEQFNWHPFPVYMPAHWVPVGIARLLHMDSRWAGLGMLLLTVLVYVYYTNRREPSLFKQLLTVILLMAILQIFYSWGDGDLFISYETPVAAFYLLLALGLQQRSLVLTMTGIILCMLSRYTMVFWLPVFALMLLHEKPLKYSVFAWGSLVAAFLFFYIIPFIMKQPDILKIGVAYHNGAAISEWSGDAWSFELGTYFAPHFKAIFGGDMEHKVFFTRIVQGSLMILLNIAGYIGYRKWKNKVNFYDYSLILLYTVLIFFYAFGPLTYRYYLITTMFLSAVITINIIRQGKLAPQGAPEQREG